MKSKKIALICALDGSANSIVSLEIKKYLERNGHTIETINTINLNKITYKKFSSFNNYNLIVYLFIVCNMLLNLLIFIQVKHIKWTKKYLYYFFITSLMKIRAHIFLHYFKNKDFDLIICETQIDAYYFTYEKRIETLYHCPTPWADELYFGNEISKTQYNKLIKIEKSIYRNSTYLAFHSAQYNDYVKKYIYDGSNIITLNMGCNTTGKTRARYSPVPKIVYVGFLEGYWINIELLSYLSKIYPQIDVYGSPPPDKKYGLNYKGYLKDLNVLSEYQFGLITLSKDKLRREGFSAKHLEYISYGLPVLVPDWRTAAKKIKGTIYYNENNFIKIIQNYKKEKKWNVIHEEAIIQSRSLSWDITLQPLSTIINNANS